MAKKRFIVEIGTGVDLHGEDVTEAACRAVKDAISRSCLCGLSEIVGLEKPGELEVDVVIASPKPEEVDLERVKEALPAGRKTASSVAGGMRVRGLMVPKYGPGRDHIVVANAGITVSIDR